MRSSTRPGARSCCTSSCSTNWLAPSACTRRARRSFGAARIVAHRPRRHAPVEVFISYRRDDAAGYARAIGAERVFIDVDDIGAGRTFAEVIRRAVGESKLLRVSMGPGWCGERGGRPARICGRNALAVVKARFVQTEGGSSDHVPLTFVARRMSQMPALDRPEAALGQP